MKAENVALLVVGVGFLVMFPSMAGHLSRPSNWLQGMAILGFTLFCAGAILIVANALKRG